MSSFFVSLSVCNPARRPVRLCMQLLWIWRARSESKKKAKGQASTHKQSAHATSCHQPIAPSLSLASNESRSFHSAFVWPSVTSCLASCFDACSASFRHRLSCLLQLNCLVVCAFFDSPLLLFWSFCSRWHLHFAFFASPFWLVGPLVLPRQTAN